MRTWRSAMRSSSSSVGPNVCSSFDNPYLKRLFQGIDVADLNWLLSDNVNSCLYQFDLNSKSVHRLTCSDVPWPVIFLLGRRHKKFRFIANTAPRLSSLFSGIDDASSKLKWRNFFAGNERRESIPRALVYKRRVTNFGGKTDPSLAGFCRRMSSTVVSAAARAIVSGNRKSMGHGNVLPIDRAGHAWLAASNFTACPCDKEVGYCLVDVKDFVQNQLTILSSSWYTEVSPDYLNDPYWRNSLAPLYRRIASEICKIDSRTTMTILCSSLGSGWSGLASNLIHTVKTHKCPGKVAFRPVHASASHPFVGLMSWINLVSGDALAKHRHLLKSADDLVADLPTLKHVDDMIWIHWDIKDFFMQGNVDFLIEHSSLVIPKRFRAVYRRALHLILTHQFVKSRLIPNRLWRVVQGTGMGLKCSSNVADTAFLHAMELMGCGIALRRNLERRGILFYRRFRDNLLFATHPNFVRIKQFLQQLESARPYTGEVEECSPIGVTFLDLNIISDLKTREVLFTPNLKPTSLSSILGLQTAHPIGVHAAWLKAYLFRLRSRSCSIEWYLSFKHQVFQRLRDYGVDCVVLAALDRETTYTYPVPALGHRVRRAEKDNSVFRIVLPYHPVWHKALQRVCADLSLRLRNLDVDGLRGIKRFSVAWSLRSSTLGNSVLKY